MVHPLDGLFYAFSALALGSAILVITLRRAVLKVFSLLVLFLFLSLLFLMAGDEFIAMATILVHTSTVAALFIFTVMLAGKEREEERGVFPWGAAGCLIFLMVEIGYQTLQSFPDLEHIILKGVGRGVFAASDLGLRLYTRYALPVGLSGVLMLVTMVGGIALMRGARREFRRQDPGKQTRQRGNISLVSIPFKRGVP